jgi:NADPH:quinone reductase-like Zn-dependent oxidoreductase
MMRALVQRAFGPASSVLSVRRVERPSPGRAEVLVRVRAAGIAKGTWLMTRGLPYIARPSYGFWKPRQRVAGLQFAGTVAALGDEAQGVALEEHVFGYASGALAEYVAVPVEGLARKPAGLSFKQAASVPISGVTALQAVRDSAKIQPGQHALVIGASGGVGSFVVQIAKAAGAEVSGVASTRNLELVRRLGADHVVDYTRQDPTTVGRTYDVVIDLAGNRRVSRLRRIVRRDGTLVIVGGTGNQWTMGFERTIGGMLRSPFVPQRIVGLISKPRQQDLVALAKLIEAGALNPLVERSYPLQCAAEAIESVGSESGAGTLVVTL